VDGVNSSAGACITSNWASRRRRSFGGGIGNRVSGSAASTLECVVKSEPVTDLVGSSLSLVVVSLASTGHRGAQDAASIVVKVVAAGGSSNWEVAVSQVAHGFHEVKIEIFVGSLAESLLHGELGSISSPSRVNSPISTSQGK